VFSKGDESMALTDPLQWIVIAVVAVVFLMWGPKKIPELARSLGLARQEFSAVSKSVQETTGKLQNPNAILDSLIVEPQQSIRVQQPQPPPQVASAQNSGDEALVDTASKLGISTQGKTKDQISKEILAKAGFATVKA
jgi:sec-independent protein translocase protein TatA